ncbi:MAG: phosphate/sulfate permease [Halocynthiibacter sp.]|jgi:phosphate/sulfate permease
MIVIICALIGGLIGFATAKRKGGNRLDILQYIAVFAIIAILIGLFLTVILERML